MTIETLKPHVAADTGPPGAAGTIDDLQAPEDYIAARRHLFPSGASFEWFVRRNRAELVKAGALLRPTWRWLVKPQAFDQAIATIGARRAGVNGG